MSKITKDSLEIRERDSSLNNGKFSITDFSFREFQTFLILLKHEGEELSTLKNIIDIEFEFKSRTKGYDHINNLYNRGIAYKKVHLENGKKITKMFINKQIRKEYENLIIPTINDMKNALHNLYKTNSNDLKNLEIIHEKFKSYTQNIITAIQTLIKNTDIVTIKNQQFQKKINDLIWKYFKAEMLKYEMFSK
ncbi:MAG: hypothetical protein ACFE8J_10905 [Candidatus Heimdallarchaeota archaeon]